LAAFGSMPSALIEQEGVSARGVVARGREVGVARAEQRLDAAGGPLRRQRPGPDRGGRGVGEDLGERHCELAHLGGPRREQQHHRQIRDSKAQEALGGHGRLVGPLGVVDRDEQRLPAREVGDQPVQPVQTLVHQLRVVGLLLAARLEDRQGELCRPGEEGGAVLLGLLELDGVRRLAHDAVRVAPLQLGGAHGDRVHAPLAGEIEGGVHQPRLADAGRPLDRHDAAAAADGRLQGAVQRRDLGVPLEQAGIGLLRRGTGIGLGHAAGFGWGLRVHCLCKHPPSGGT
jgi:hypothetical protein